MPFKNTYTTFDDVECGLVSIHDGGFVLPLYLEACSVDVQVVNHIGHYIVRQTYCNLTDETIEALYVYPIQEGGAVHYFTAESNGKVVTSVVKEKDKSESSYMDEDDLATADTRTSFLISEFKPDIYQLAIGTLEANSVTTIELRYVCELPIENNAVMLTIPNTVAPQYTLPPNECAEKTAADQLVDTAKDIEIVLSVMLRQTCPFKQTCDTNEIVCTEEEGTDEDGFYCSNGTVSIKRTAFEEEVVVYVSTVGEKTFGARILIEETSKAEVAAMVTIVPEFPAVDFQAEMIFLVDRSGSMQGRSIEKAKEALHIFLASLPSDCKFNICSFNASFDFLFDTSVQYNDENLTKARQYTDDMRAGGGTRVYEPLETIFKQKLEDGCKRQIFVLTDGHVSRPTESIKMVNRYTKQARVFTLGIGEGASRELVNGLARSGNGSALFVTFAEDLKDKVLELLSASLLSGLSNISFDWLSDMKPQKKLFSFFRSSAADDVGTVLELKEKSAPHPIPHVFSTRLLLVYQSLEFGNLPVGLRITGTGPDGDVMMLVNLDSTKVMKSELLHKLMARRMVKMLEEDDKDEDVNLQARMTKLGVNYNITNKWCSNTTTDQFGSATKKTKGASVTMTEGAMFQPAPPGMVRSSSPPSPLMYTQSKGKKKSSLSLGSSGGGGGGSRYQVSNTRMAKSKCMSGYSAPMMQQRQSRQMQQMGGPPMQLQMNCAPDMMNIAVQDCDQQIYSSESKSKQRDDTLMGFTVLQMADGGFSYGPAFFNDLSMTEDDINKGAAEFGVTKELFMTLIVAIYLRSVMANRKSSWSRIGEKADGFIAVNIGSTDLAALEKNCEQFIDRFIMGSRSNVLFKGYKKR